jgi:succinate dehydrogenase / fumarate reductase flavoprotein subunit
VEIDFYSVREELGDVFYKNVGIVRDKKSLETTLNVVNGYIAKLPLMGAKDNSKLYNTNRVEFLEFKNTLELSRLVLVGAIAREESRGAHFRVDFPKESKLFEMHTIIDRDGVVDAK